MIRIKTEQSAPDAQQKKKILFFQTSRLALGSTKHLFTGYTGSSSRDVAYQLTTQMEHLVPGFKANGAKTLPSKGFLDVDSKSYELTHK
jgi:hypothetical protein